MKLKKILIYLFLSFCIPLSSVIVTLICKNGVQGMNSYFISILNLISLTYLAKLFLNQMKLGWKLKSRQDWILLLASCNNLILVLLFTVSSPLATFYSVDIATKCCQVASWQLLLQLILTLVVPVL